MIHVYLSPHLDDVVLSCGGTVHRQARSGGTVLVITIFAGEYEGAVLSPFALEQHAYWSNPPRPMALRRAEDAAALALLEAEVLHLDYLDAVYRASPGDQWLYVDLETLFGDVQPDDPVGGEETRDLAERLAALIPPPDQTVIYAPLGIGHHVDHQIVHRAARHLFAAGYPVAFFEDFPYSERAGALESALDEAGDGQLRLDVVQLDAGDLSARVLALGYYRSQMALLFGGTEAMASRVWAFAATRSPQAGLAERFWWLQ